MTVKRPPSHLGAFSRSNVRCATSSDKGVNFWTNRFPRLVKVINDRAFDIVGMQELTPKQREYLDEALGSAWGRIGVGRLVGDMGESMTIYYRKGRWMQRGNMIIER